MHNLILQMQFLLAALSALLPLLPAEARGRAGEILSAAGGVLSLGAGVSGQWGDLANKLAGIRADIEAMARAGRAVTPEELDAALARVRIASVAFRAALETAESAP